VIFLCAKDKPSKTEFQRQPKPIVKPISMFLFAHLKRRDGFGGGGVNWRGVGVCFERNFGDSCRTFGRQQISAAAHLNRLQVIFYILYVELNRFGNLSDASVELYGIMGGDCGWGAGKELQCRGASWKVLYCLFECKVCGYTRL